MSDIREDFYKYRDRNGHTREDRDLLCRVSIHINSATAEVERLQAALDAANRDIAGLREELAAPSEGFEELKAELTTVREQLRWRDVREEIPKQKGEYLVRVVSDETKDRYEAIASWCILLDAKCLGFSVSGGDYTGEYAGPEMTGLGDVGSYTAFGTSITHWLPIPEQKT